MASARIEISAEKFAAAQFPPHGRYSAESVGQLVRMQATGPFNAELLTAYHVATLPLLNEVAARGAMVTLVEFHESMMMSPDALSIFAAAVAESEREGGTSHAVAYVAGPDVEGRDIMIPLIANHVFGSSICRFQAFETIEPALAWLNELLAETAPNGQSVLSPLR